MKLLVAIVENEENQVEVTTAFCQRYSKEKGLEIQINTFSNGFDFLEKGNEGYDCVFMDIDMPGINGMETSKKFRQSNQKTEIVFVTNLPQYAIDGYKVHALDFLLKPMTYADFSLVMGKLVTGKGSQAEESFILNIHGSIRKFTSSELDYIEMIRHDVYLHLSNGEAPSFRGTIKWIEKEIPQNIFCKCNSGIIVNLSKVKSIEDDVLLLEDGTRINYSRSHKKELMSQLTEFYSGKGHHSL